MMNNSFSVTGDLVLKNWKVLLYLEMLYCLYYEEVNDILLPKEKNLKNGKIAPKNILNLIIFKNVFCQSVSLWKNFSNIKHASAIHTRKCMCTF